MSSGIIGPPPRVPAGESVILKSARVVENPINLRKEGVNLVRAVGTSYKLSCLVDISGSEVCVIEAWAGGSVNEDFVVNGGIELAKMVLDPGLSKTASFNESIDKSHWVLNSSKFGIIVSLTQGPNRQISLGFAEETETGQLHVHISRQMLILNGRRWEYYDLFGADSLAGKSIDSIAEGSSSLPKDAVIGALAAEDSSRECVVCMTNERDTTVLPCRHLCLCFECAEMIRKEPPVNQKCPICRVLASRLVKLI